MIPERPGTCPSQRSKLVSARRVSGKKEAEPHDGHEIELLEYEWPDLPPIDSVKEALTRQRVSRGISYLLPVDKGRNAINNHYRTNLRAMFQEPYASAGVDYDDTRQTLSSKVHFLANTSDNVWKRSHMDAVNVTLNSECERYRKLYARSAPSGRSAQRMGIDTTLRTRSNLFLPIKAKIPPEAIKMRQEAEKLIKSAQEQNDEFDEDLHKEPIDEEMEDGQLNSRRQSIVVDQTRLQRRQTIVSILPTSSKKLEAFRCYDDFKVAKVPKLTIPSWIRSPFLTKEQNQIIWEWLHCGEETSEFQYFLAMCG